MASGRSGGDLKDSDYAADRQDGEDRRPDSPRTMMIKANLAKVTCYLPGTDSSPAEQIDWEADGAELPRCKWCLALVEF